ncbi:MAG: hypothetical protein ABIH71_03390 [Candidatus Omnitrophota bacterium]|nr:hypothetical protein [Candidatus Omnitrophota bacterium]
MKKTKFSSIILVFLLSMCLGCQPKWNEETARQKVFRNIQYKIDVSQYPAIDPYYETHQKALENGEEKVSGRFITKNSKPPISYVVSQWDKKGLRITMFYKENGKLDSIRLFSNPGYPTVASIYCVEDSCQNGDEKYKSGELMSIALHPSNSETFYFRPDGQFNGHVKF